MMLLYEHPLSSYAQKVKIALREKSLVFDKQTPGAIGTGKADGPFATASPRNEVPALIDGAARIFDSTIILEYLEDKYPTPHLMPADPVARADARMIEEVCDSLYEAINWGLSEIRWFKRAEGAKAEEMKATAARQTAELQAWLTGKLGGNDFFNGDAFGWADLSVAPYVNRSFHYGMGTPDGSPLARWLGRIRERPSVAETFKEFEAVAGSMGDAAQRVASGQIRREYRDHRLEWMMKSGGVQIVLDGIAKNTIRFTWPL
jgi:glutathione S-transferase